MGFSFQGYGVQIDPVALVVLAASGAAMLVVFLLTACDRPWWKRKRYRVTAAAFVAALPVAYPVADPLLDYAAGRRWISFETRSRIGVVHRPLRLALEATGLSRTRAYSRWCDLNVWCERAGRRHRAGFYE